MMATIKTKSFYKKDVSCQLLLHKEQYHLKYMLPTPHLPKLKGEYSRFYSQINVFFVKYLYWYRQERKYQNILRGPPLLAQKTSVLRYKFYFNSFMLCITTSFAFFELNTIQAVCCLF